MKFLQLLVVHHPSRRFGPLSFFYYCLFVFFYLHHFWILILFIRCRKGTAEILVDLDDLSANKELASLSQKGVFGNYQICGKEIPRGYWVCIYQLSITPFQLFYTPLRKQFSLLLVLFVPLLNLNTWFITKYINNIKSIWGGGRKITQRNEPRAEDPWISFSYLLSLSNQ